MTENLTTRERDLLARLRVGERLVGEIDNTEAGKPGRGMRFWLESSGRSCGPANARGLIEKGAVRVVSPGLFEGARAQAWEAA